MSSARQNRIVAAALLATMLAAAPALGAPQGPPEIEAESITEQGTLDPFVADDEDLRSIFDEAERLFRSFDQPDSVPLFDRLIARLEADRKRRPLPSELLEMLILSRSHRAEAHFNLGENESAEVDLRRILELDPGWRMDPDLVSPKLVELADRLRREMVGEILVLVEPADARVLLAGRPLEAVGQAADVLAGTWPLVISRPGFTSVEEDVEVRAGRSVTVDHTLERLSAVVRLRARPAGVTVLLDGAPAVVAERVAVPEGAGEEEIAIEVLQPGAHTLELDADGYRRLGLRFEVLDLDDYWLPPALLELEEGELRLTALPEGARVEVDGEPASPPRTGGGDALLRLPPGEYLIEVHQPGVGGFRQRVAVADQQVIDLAVELRPTLAFLGVLGSDRLTAGDLAERVRARLGSLEEWIWTDHSIDAAATLDELGLSALQLRRVGAVAGAAGAPDWAPVQSRFDRDFGGSLYLLAVLGDDLFATTADLWLWSPSPWPATPARLTLPVEGAAELAELARAFDAPPVPAWPRLGARFIDSGAAGAPVTLTVMEGGPAAKAALAAGDRVFEVDGTPVASVAELVERAASRSGEELRMRVGSASVAREIELRPAVGLGVLSLTDDSLLDPVLAARLSLELLGSEEAAPRWLVQLNQAALLLRARALEEAVQLLRRIEAPAGPGLGRAMVDYWLGTTLLSLDPRGYAQAARAALERALAEPGARLHHDDGALLAPRARARLAELERLLAD